MLQPETRYAAVGDARVAYQVFGKGGLDLILAAGPVSNTDLIWDEPHAARFLQRLGEFARVAIFDRRGTGLSDPIEHDEPPILERQVEDMLAVANAAEMKRPSVFGSSAATSMCAMFAAAYPDRVSALVLVGSAAAGGTMLQPETRMAVLDEIENTWGAGRLLALYSPDHADDEALRHWFGRYERGSTSPSFARRLLEVALAIDVTDILPTIQAPTLVLHRRDDRMVPIDDGRRVADLITGARFIELPGNDHFVYMGDQTPLLEEIEEFLTGVRPAPEPDRVLATVLFTDIVASTETAARLGDSRWREVLEAHRTMVGREVESHRGRQIKDTGDGVLAVFDGPTYAVRCARSLTAGLPRQLGLELRAGVHTGEVELIGDDVGGIAVHIGARVCALAAASEVLVSSTVKDLAVGSGIQFEPRGGHTLKGIPDQWQILAVTGSDPR